MKNQWEHKMTIKRALINGKKQAFLALVLMTFNTICMSAQTNVCQASKQAMSVYNDFRQKFPHHFQSVCASDVYADGSCLFIISQPTPDVAESEIRKLFTPFSYSLEIIKHPLGYDGYIKDVLVVVKNVNDSQVIELKKGLHQLLYSSSYKADRATIKLPVKAYRGYFAKDNINYSISPGELNDWFITKNEPFTNDQGQKFGVKTLLNSNTTGVFFSESPGFVAWVINKKNTLKKEDIRKFVLDADLCLGGFANNTKLVLIGRERESPLTELPPLSIETIMALASCRQPSLSQSLDMNDVLAGRIQQENYDWCPTYFSSSILECTEYGNLLTINDLLLKKWSESGRLRFLDIEYPDPASYPFSKPLLSEILLNQEQTTIVYNWNSDKSVYALKLPTYTIYSLASTGALPVSYYGDQQSKVSLGGQYEKKAYNYFAESKNTDLARAAQYNFLYVVMFDNKLYLHTSPQGHNIQTKKPYILEQQVLTLLKNIKNSSSADNRRIAYNIASSLAYDLLKDTIVNAKAQTKIQFEEMVQQEIRKNNVSASAPAVMEWIRTSWDETERNLNEQISMALNETTKMNQEHIFLLINTVQATLQSMSTTELAECSKYLSYPRGEEVAHYGRSLTFRRLMEDLSALTMIDGVFKSIFESYGVRLSDVMNYYTRSLQQEESRWIKSPSLIRSFYANHFIGGHNVTALPKRIASFNEYAPVGNSSHSNIIRSRAIVIPQITRVQRGL